MMDNRELSANLAVSRNFREIDSRAGQMVGFAKLFLMCYNNNNAVCSFYEAGSRQQTAVRLHKKYKEDF